LDVIDHCIEQRGLTSWGWKGFEDGCEVGVKFGSLFFIQGGCTDLGRCFFVLFADDFFLHEIHVSTSTESVIVSSIVSVDTEAMAVVVSFLEAVFAEKGFLTDGAIIADEN
jgi:hypothetical protein